jgi:predicted dehydrogenase
MKRGMIMRKIKAGIIGTGFIAPAHVEAVRRLGFVDVVAIAGSSQEVADKKASELGIPRAYGDYRKLIEDPEVEVVHNCTPNSLHYEINMAIIKAGKHVLSEKPLAMNSEECKSLVQAARAASVINGVNFNYRMYPLVQHLKAEVRDGKLGEVYLVHGSYLQDWLLYEIDFSWRLLEEVGGKLRAVSDIGSHWMDLIQYITGERVTAVFADLATVFPVRKKPKGNIQTFQTAEGAEYEEVPISTEDYASILFRLSNGARGTCVVSQVSAGRKNRLTIEINGSRSSALWNQEEPAQLWFGYRDKPNEVMLADPSLLHPDARAYNHYPGGHNEAWPDGNKNMMNQFYRFILEGKEISREWPSFATFEDGYRAAKIAEAVLESHLTSRWTEVQYEEEWL